MPLALSYLHVHLEQLAQEGLVIVSAMPNWLVTAAPVFYGYGGPVFRRSLHPSLLFPQAAMQQLVGICPFLINLSRLIVRAQKT